MDNEILKHVLLRKGAENWFIKDKVKMYWLILLLWLGTNKGLQYDITSHSMPYLKDTCQINKEAFFSISALNTEIYVFKHSTNIKWLEA